MADHDERCSKKQRIANLNKSTANLPEDHILYEPVKPGVTECLRSRLLSGAAGAKALAELPPTICHDEVKLWQAAHVNDCEQSTDDLATIVRVADALGDTSASTWTAALGKRAYATDWQHPAEADAMTYALLSLPPHLLHAVLCDPPAATRPCHTLQAFPAPLQAAVLAATTSNGVLVIDGCLRSISDLLSEAVFPLPGLTALVVSGPPFCDRSSKTAAATLARALAAHPSITSLSLRDPLCPDWLTQLTNSLPACALPALRSLKVDIRAHPGGCAALSRCLKRLSCISHLDVTIQRNSHQNPDPPELSTLLRAAACPAALPRLTELSLHETHGPEDEEADRSGERVPHHRDSIMLQLLPMLHAPALTRLQLASGAALVSVPRLCCALRHLTGLLHIGIDAHVGSAAEDEEVEAAVLPPALRVLDVLGACPVEPLSMASALAAKAPRTLSTLRLRDSLMLPDYYCPYQKELRPAWRSMTVAVGQLQHLRSLWLEVLSAGMGLAGTAGLARILCNLPQLTELGLNSIHGADDFTVEEYVNISDGSDDAGVLCAELIIPALQRAQHLQTLSLECSIDVPLLDDPLAVLGACSVLHALSRVDFVHPGVDMRKVVGLLPRLHRLRRLKLLHECAEWDPEGSLVEALVERAAPAVEVDWVCFEAVDSEHSEEAAVEVDMGMHAAVETARQPAVV